MSENFDWKKYLIECLQSTDYCAIATTGIEGVWNNPVHFAWDESFNLYFISQMRSTHMRNLSNDKQVAVAIYKTEQKDDLIGIQIKGKAEILTGNPGAIKEAHNIYYARVGIDKTPDDSSWIFVKIIPEKVSYFDTRHFGENRQEVPLDAIK